VIPVSAYPDRVNVFRQAARDAGAEVLVTKVELNLEMVRSWNPGAV